MMKHAPLLLAGTVSFGVLLTLAMMFYAFEYLVDVERAAFDKQVRALDLTLSADLEDMRDELRGLGNVLYAKEKVEEATLRLNTEHMFAQYPAIRSAVVAMKVMDKQRQSFVQYEQDAGFVDYAIHDVKQGAWQAAGQRSVYFPVYLVEPFDVDHVLLLGLDLLANPRLQVPLQDVLGSGLDVGVVADFGLGVANLWLFQPIYAGFLGKIDDAGKQMRMINGVVGIEVDLSRLLMPKALDKDMYASFSWFEGRQQGKLSAATLILQVGEDQDVPWWSGFSLSHAFYSALHGQEIHGELKKAVRWFDSGFWLFFLSGIVGLGFTGMLLLSMRALVQSEARNRNIVDSAFEGVMSVSGQGLVLDVNPAAERIFACTTGSCLGCGLDQFIAFPEWCQEKSTLDAYLSLNPLYLNQFNHLKAAAAVGQDKDLEVSISQVPTSKGATLYSLFVREVTQKKKNERELARLAMVVEQSYNLIVITDEKGLIQYVNPAFERVSGFSAREAMGKNANIVKSGEHEAEYYAEMWDALTQGGQWSGNFTNKSKEGALYDVEQSTFPMWVDGAIAGFVSIQQDVTEKNCLQTQSDHAQRLESLGVLAGGIAHDFNNLLTAIMGHAGMAQRQEQEGTKQYRHLHQIMKASQSAANLCQQMLAYSGKGAFVIKSLNLSESVRGISQLLSSTINKRVEMRLDLAASLPWIEADEGQIQQVIMNLIINASEAMGDKSGVVEVQTRLTCLTDNDLPSLFAGEDIKAGNYVLLRVVDHGCGMNSDILKKIFDPFFTTKFTGRGLGMSALLGIVRGHQGGLRVSSVVGQGTVFEVFFPESDVQKEGWTREVMKAAKRSPTSGMVLVVDDEAVVRDLATMLLEDVGLQVMTAKDGVEGLEVLRAHQSEIDAILLDMTMPKMSGDEFYKAMRQFAPDLPVIVSSGYAEQDIRERFADEGMIAFIQKPYEPDVLANKMMEVLKGP